MRVFCYLSLCILLSFPNKGNSQRILNGSFENSESFYMCGDYSNDTVNFNRYVKDVHMHVNTPGNGYLFMRRDSTSSDNLRCLFSTIDPLLNPKHPPHGKYMAFFHSFPYWADSVGLPTQLVFSLSAPLKAHHHYNLRFASSCTRNHPTTYSLHACLSNRKDIPQQLIGKVNPRDTVGYREYSIPFIPDSDYQYITIYNYVSKNEYDGGTANDALYNMLDNLRLDTCVTLQGSRKKYISDCNSLPIKLQSDITGNHYYWSNKDTQQIVRADTFGIYTVVIANDTTSCATIDSFEVVRDTGYSVSHESITVAPCQKTDISLTSKKNGKYEWNTGDTTRSIHVDTVGIFWVKTTDSTGCVYTTDSFTMLYDSYPVFNITDDTAFCDGDSVMIDVFDMNYDHYLWNTGDTSSGLLVKDSGTYIVKAWKGFCAAYDTIVISSSELPEVNLATDTTFCKGAMCMLSVPYDIRNEYLWNTGEKTNSILVKDSGIFYVRVKNGFCASFDTLRTHLYIPDTLSIFNDTSICAGISVILNAYQNMYNKYRWNTGDSIASIVVKGPGLYIVTASKGACTTTDSITVFVFAKPNIYLPSDVAVCFDDLEAIILDAGEWKSYAWYPTGEHTRTIAATYPEIYVVVITDSNNCVGIDSTLIEETCPPDFYIPNTFSPNGDGVNEVFLARGRGIEYAIMSIYDRWGQLLYKSENIEKGWDGTAYDIPCPVGVYTYIIEYRTQRLKLRKISRGNVTLLR